MIVKTSLTINASKAAVWAATTDIANHAQLLSTVERIEVVSRPATGLVGLRWKETRMLLGKEATVEKWITQAKENEYYTTRAEQDGFVFITTNRVSGNDGSVTLTGIHETQPQGFAANMKSLPMIFFKGVIKKAIMQDLDDVKKAVESIDWEPIGRQELGELIANGLAKTTAGDRSLFTCSAIEPAKWRLTPWGDMGGGFWAVAVMEDRVLWYNDIEEGFNVSRFEIHGTIPSTEYWCNQSELYHAIPALAGQPQGKFGPPQPL
ncbi:MAG: SRPBCC family protein [Flavobacteriales bacterium]|nr:SRPBCC family protein [Flavobacteriales bacterium]